MAAAVAAKAARKRVVPAYNTKQHKPSVGYGDVFHVAIYILVQFTFSAFGIRRVRILIIIIITHLYSVINAACVRVLVHGLRRLNSTLVLQYRIVAEMFGGAQVSRVFFASRRTAADNNIAIGNVSLLEQWRKSDVCINERVYINVSMPRVQKKQHCLCNVQSAYGSGFLVLAFNFDLNLYPIKSCLYWIEARKI